MQDYPEIEVVISDDCSTDASEHAIRQYLAAKSNGSIGVVYVRQPHNVGYDANLRAALSVASGEYLFILGNDDALYDATAISRLAGALEALARPDAAFSNFSMYGDRSQVARRAEENRVLGRGPKVALRYFRSLSFVGGIALRRSVFADHNTSAQDGSIYVQIYLVARIVAAGGSLAAIAETTVAKDVIADGRVAHSYKDSLANENKYVVPKTGGLDEVGRVACEAILPYVPAARRNKAVFVIYAQLLGLTYPFWIHDYRARGVPRAAFNLMLGCAPSRLTQLTSASMLTVLGCWLVYAVASVVAWAVPPTLLRRASGPVRRVARLLIGR